MPACFMDAGPDYFNLNLAFFCHLDDVENLLQISSNFMHNYSSNLACPCKSAVSVSLVQGGMDETFALDK